MRSLLLLCVAVAALGERKAIRPPASANAGPYSAGIVTDKFVYVSGHVGPEPDGRFALGDVKQQTRRCLELVHKVLVEAGLDWANVVSATLYLTDIRTLDAADAAWREVFRAPYPARVEIESTLLIAEALAEVSVIAARGDPRKTIYLRPPGWKEPGGPWSHGVYAEGVVFASTVRPVNPATGVFAGGTAEAQMDQVKRNMDALLAVAKLTEKELVGTRVFLSRPSMGARVRPGLGMGAVLMNPYAPGHLVQMHASADKAGAMALIGATGAGPGIREQTREALRRIEEQLKKLGMGWGNTVESTVWLRDARHAAEMNAVYREIVKPEPPARATVRLAPVDEDALIEVVMTAVR